MEAVVNSNREESMRFVGLAESNTAPALFLGASTPSRPSTGWDVMA